MIKRRGVLAVVLLGWLSGVLAGVPGAASASQAAVSATLPPAYRAPYTPANDADRLQEVPSAADPKVGEMRSLRSQLDAAPQSLDAAILLADSYIDYSRQIGDAHYAGYAEAVIAPWLALATPPATVLLTEATILQYRHEFDAARALLDATLRKDPHNAQAWLTTATLDMVQGRYEAARKDCSQVMNTAGLELGSACLGNLLAYTGQARRSIALLEQSARTSARLPDTYRAWIDGLIAESAERLGDWPLAEAHYRSALQALPHDNFLLVAYADFLLDRNRPNEVLPLLADHLQSDTAFLRIALAQAALGSPERSRYTWMMAARFEALRQRGSDYFGREEARFALSLQHDPQTALQMAQRNWALQRAPWDARVVLEAALAAHQPHAADGVTEFIEQTRLEDPLLHSLVDQLRAASAPTLGSNR